MASITRRSLVKGAGIAAGAAAVTSMAAPVSALAAEDPSYAGTVDVPSFLIAPDLIPADQIAETKDYDVVVIGAGAAGVPATLAAVEAGASVACLQKESVAISQGNSGCGVQVDKSDKVAIEGMISYEMEENAHRPDRRQLSNWAYRSGEAMDWLLDRAEKAGAQFTTSESTMDFAGGTVTFIKNSFGPKPYTTGDAMQALAAYAETLGAEFFYETPAIQLVKEDGRVIGVVAQAADGTYLQFNATKGVIVATGDYQNDYDMCSYYIPDLDNFERKQSGKTGDGHKMVVWAGGKIEDGNHTKMLHDFDAGPGSMADMPFLAVKDDGTRFCDETTPMSLLNNYLRGPKDCGWYSQIFDNDYLTTTETWPGKAVDEETMRNYMPEEEVEGGKQGVLEYYTRTFKADTLEELAEKLLITDVDTFVATVERYNELCEVGADEDFGKDPAYLAPIVTPPFWGIHRHVRISAITAGVEVNPDQQCLTPEGDVIEGLYAVGNCAGNFYGGVDYPLAIGGLSLGRCYTQGYLVGSAVAGK